jgi:hypothetical protein
MNLIDASEQKGKTNQQILPVISMARLMA